MSKTLSPIFLSIYLVNLFTLQTVVGNLGVCSGNAFSFLEDVYKTRRSYILQMHDLHQITHEVTVFVANALVSCYLDHCKFLRDLSSFNLLKLQSIHRILLHILSQIKESMLM